MVASLHWPELVAQLESVDNIPVHVYVRGALRPLTDVRRCGECICAQAGSYELSALTSDAAATLWRAVQQMAIGNHSDDAFVLVEDLVAPITGMWLLQSDSGFTGRIVAFTCAPAWRKATALPELP